MMTLGRVNGTRQPQSLHKQPRGIGIRPGPVRDDANTFDSRLQLLCSLWSERGVLDGCTDGAQHQGERLGGILSALGLAIVDVANAHQDGNLCYIRHVGRWGYRLDGRPADSDIHVLVRLIYSRRKGCRGIGSLTECESGERILLSRLSGTPARGRPRRVYTPLSR